MTSGPSSPSTAGAESAAEHALPFDGAVSIETTPPPSSKARPSAVAAARSPVASTTAKSAMTPAVAARQHASGAGRRCDVCAEGVIFRGAASFLNPEG